MFRTKNINREKEVGVSVWIRLLEWRRRPDKARTHLISRAMLLSVVSLSRYGEHGNPQLLYLAVWLCAWGRLSLVEPDPLLCARAQLRFPQLGKRLFHRGQRLATALYLYRWRGERIHRRPCLRQDIYSSIPRMLLALSCRFSSSSCSAAWLCSLTFPVL